MLPVKGWLKGFAVFTSTFYRRLASEFYDLNFEASRFLILKDKERGVAQFFVEL